MHILISGPVSETRDVYIACTPLSAIIFDYSVLLSFDQRILALQYVVILLFPFVEFYYSLVAS